MFVVTRATSSGGDTRSERTPESAREPTRTVDTGSDEPEAPAEPSDGRSLRALRLRTERRTQILGVARDMFASRGYHETSIQDLLDRADIARGTFYLHFDSKRAIFDELIDDFLGRIRSVVTVVDIGLGAPPPLRQIEDNLDRVFTVLKNNREMTRITLLLAEGLDAQLDAKMADFYGRLLALLRHALVLGQSMGLVRSCDAQVVAQVALGGLKEVVLNWVVRRDSTPDELAGLSHEILTYALHGLLVSPT
jgi:TetR/AcrR family fatty acid metabolism transcriptional regulator